MIKIYYIFVLCFLFVCIYTVWSLLKGKNLKNITKL